MIHIHDSSHLNCVCSIVYPVLKHLVCHDSHCCSVIQGGNTALDMARAGNTDASRYGEVIKYLEEFGK